MRKLAQYFTSLESIVASQYALYSGKNPSDRGEDREDFLVGILNNHLPAVSRAYRGGTIMDCWDTTSRQTDIVVYSSHSPMLKQDKKPLFLAEGVFAAIEVKSVLNSDALASALELSRELKQMQKFLLPKESGIFGWGDTVKSICTGLFAYTSKIRSSNTVLNRLYQYHKSGVPNHQMIDFVCVNGRFCLSRHRTESIAGFISKDGQDRTEERRRECLYLGSDRQAFATMLATILEYVSYVGPTVHRLSNYLNPVSSRERSAD